jgi:cytochrome c oxidase subunit II
MYSGLLSTAPTATTYDNLLNWYLTFGVGAAIIVITLLVIFMVRYRYRGQQTLMPHHKTEGWKIVLVTALISLTVLTAAEYQTFASFGNIEIPNNATCMQQTGAPCITIKLEAFQWGWNFTYPNGMFTVSTNSNSTKSAFYVPAGRDIVVNISSRDVFHSFGISMLAVKEDAIPGKTNQLWFEMPTVTFNAPPDVKVECNGNSTTCTYIDAIRCFELCGVGHATMDANLTVMSDSAWETAFG